MNQIYRLIWNHTNQAWVAVAETAKSHGKSACASKLVAAAVLAGGTLLTPASYAADAANAKVVGGAGAVSQSGTTTTINQTSQRMAIDWTSLSTTANEALVFKQPNVSAIALNRITGASPSALLGSLSANGQVYILNPNGVLFGAGAQVNVGGLVASTLSINPADFMAGSSSFTKEANATGSVVNQGTLNAADGGYVALLSGTVRNAGTINAPRGSALLAGADKVTLNINNGSLIGYTVDQGALNALVENKQLIRADGGQVVMVAKALDKLSTAVINNTGIVEAHTVQNQNGRILLLSDMDVGTVNVGGTLDASAPVQGNGGFIETSAAHVKVSEGTKVTTLAAQGQSGTWLIDPVDFTVAASGGDMSGATLSLALDGSDVVIQSTQGGTTGNGDININDTVSWSAPSVLRLRAQRNININRSITATNASGKVALQYGLNAPAGNGATYNIKAPINLQAGNNFLTQLGSAGAPVLYTVITSLGSAGSTTGTDLQGIAGNLAGNFVLGGDIDATATSGWNSGAGFAPLGTIFASGFSGTFDGLGHAISNLAINRSGTSNVGLFGSTESSGTIQNVGIVGGSVTGQAAVGGLVGYNNRGTVSNSYATGSVSGLDSVVGGLVGYNNGGTVSNSYATGAVSSRGSVGGLVGQSNGTVSNSYATGSVTGSDAIGGLVGQNDRTVSNSYATGSVSGQRLVGGLVGQSSGTISNSYATGSVTGLAAVGGLVGYNTNTVSNSYATGSVTGLDSIGGLVGYNTNTVSNSYATGSVTGSVASPYAIGGLVGANAGNITASFWNTQTSGANTGIGVGGSSGVTGINNADASTLSTFTNAGWNIDAAGGTGTIWRIYEGQGGPLLRSFLTSVTVTANATSKTYDGNTSTSSTYGTSINGAVLGGSLNYGTSKNAGSYSTASGTLTQTGLYSGQQGYDISYANASLTINKANLTVTANAVTKTYDGTTTAAGTATATAGTTVFAGDSLSGGSFAFSDKNAGTGNKTVNVAGVTVNDGNGGNNYNVTYASNSTSTIDKANLTVTASAASKTYDGTTRATGSAIIGALAGAAAGDVVNSGGSEVFADKNAGTGNKTVFARGVTIKDAGNADVTGNYNINYISNTTGTINKADLIATTAGVNKVYDGTAAATVTYTDNRIVGDALNFSSTARFANKNAGNGKTVTVSGITLHGADAGNYNLTTTTGSTLADITPASLIVAANASSKAYDGIAYAGNNGAVISGLVNGETVADLLGALSYGGASQGAIAIGNYAITPGGLRSSNYTVRFVDGTLTIKAASPVSPAGNSAFEQAYSGVQQSVADIGNSKSRQVSDKKTSSQTPGNVTEKTNLIAVSSAGSITPRLTIAGCGVTMPSGAVCQ